MIMKEKDQKLEECRGCCFVAGNKEEKCSLKNFTHIVYLCFSLAFFFGITAIVGVIISYVNVNDAKGTWLESHFRWQIRSFWFVLLSIIIGPPLLLLGVLPMMGFLGYEGAAQGAFLFYLLVLVLILGSLIFLSGVLLFIYRIIKGWVLLFRGKTIESYMSLL